MTKVTPTLLLWLALALPVAAQAPDLVHYQGEALDAEGQPLEGPIDLGISVWDRAVGGQRLYEESHPATPLTDGVFSVQIGDGQETSGTFDAALFSETERWLQVSISGETLAPRLQFTSAPFAFTANRAHVADFAEEIEGVADVGDLVSTAGGTFTGPVSVGAGAGDDAVRLRATANGGEVVVSEDGGERASLAVDPAGQGRLVLRDDAGRSMVEIGTAADGGGAGLLSDLFGEGGFVETNGPNGSINVLLTSNALNNDHGFVSVSDAQGESRAGLLVDASGQGRLQLRDTEGKVRTRVSPDFIETLGPSAARNVTIGALAQNADHGFILAADGAGGSRAELFVDLNGSGMARLRDDQGRMRTSIGAGQVETYGADGSVNVRISEGLIGRGAVSVHDSGSVPRASMEVGFDTGVFRADGPNAEPNVVIGGDSLLPDFGSLRVFDPEGRERARIGPSFIDNGVALSLHDGDDNVRALVGDGFLVTLDAAGNNTTSLSDCGGEGNDGCIFVFRDGEAVAAMAAGDNGGVIEAASPSGAVAATMEADADGAGLIRTVGPNGNTNVRLSRLGSNPNHGLAAVHNESGQVVSSLFADSAGNGRVIVATHSGGPGASMSIAAEGNGLFETFGPNGSGNVRMTAQGGNPNLGQLEILNDAGRPRVVAEVLPVGAGLLSTQGANNVDNTRMTAVVGNENHGLVSVHDSGGNARAVMFVDGSGMGRIMADSKNFVVDHPTRPGYKIVYTALEGPEAGMYHRGAVDLEDGRATIVLPEHFAVLAAPETITVQLTPRSQQSRGVAVESVADGRIDIAEQLGGTGSYEVHFLVHAVRRGFEGDRPVLADEEFEAMYSGAPLASMDGT